MNVFSPAELKRVDWRQRPDGFADIRLRRNIEKVTREPISPEGDAIVEWKAEEVYLVDSITAAEAEARFDELWSQAERDAMTERERIKAAESASDDNLNAVAELGDIVADQDTRIEEQEAALAELGDIIATIQEVNNG